MTRKFWDTSDWEIPRALTNSCTQRGWEVSSKAIARR